MLSVSFSPFPHLATHRLILRDVQLNDTAAIFEMRSNKQTLAFLDKAPLKMELEAELLIRKIITDIEVGDGITWALALNEQPEKPIGTIGLWRFEKEHHRAEIGYMLRPEYFRNGYMREAIVPVLDYGFNKLGLHSVEAQIHPGNLGSRALLLGQGFKQEGFYKENFFFDGVFKDTAVYSLLVHEFGTPAIAGQ